MISLRLSGLLALAPHSGKLIAIKTGRRTVMLTMYGFFANRRSLDFSWWLVFFSA